MKITLESTTKVVTLDGVEARLWQGTTEAGVPCHAFITLIGVDKDADREAFERELLARDAPRPDPAYAVYPLRMLL